MAGETDWKLRRAVGVCQALRSDDALVYMQAGLRAECPQKTIHKFAGNFTFLREELLDHDDGKERVSAVLGEGMRIVMTRRFVAGRMPWRV